MTATAELIKLLDLDEWLRQAGGYHAIDWARWDRTRSYVETERRKGLPGGEAALAEALIRKRRQAEASA
jgi:hypothetical protein